MSRPRPQRRQAGSYRPLRHTVTLTDADRKVLRLLEQPPLRVWPRDVLAEAAGMGDRPLRDSISRIASTGVAVLSSSGSGGYWIAATAEEVGKAKEELLSRMRVIATRAQALAQTERLLRDREAAGASGVVARPMALV